MLSVGGKRVCISQPVPLATLPATRNLSGHSTISADDRQSWVLGIVGQLKYDTMRYNTIVVNSNNLQNRDRSRRRGGRRNGRGRWWERRGR